MDESTSVTETSKLLAEHETVIMEFARAHQVEMIKNWAQWLGNNPLPDDMLADMGDDDKIQLLDVCRYRLLQQSDRLEFRELSRDDPEWASFNPKLYLETALECHEQSASRSAQRPVKAHELKLAGIGYRLVPYPDFNSILLHLDYLIAKEPPPPPPVELPSLPTNLPQQTFMEARNMAIAIADAPKMISWEKITGEVGLRHVMPGNPLQTRLLLASTPNQWDLPSTCDELSKELQNFELASVLLLNVIIGSVIQHSRMTATLDELITRIGWQPRTRADRLEMRRKVWRWLLLFDSMSIHGKRPGKYWDKVTQREIDLTSADALIRVTGRRFESQPGSDTEQLQLPMEVSWVAGNWLEQWRGNDRVLQYFGDIRKIAAVPSGKPSGAWAQSIGLALNQLWREQAAHAEVRYGTEEKVTVAFRPFTRIELLKLFRTDPWVEDVLTSNNPHRAQEYWREAMRILRYDAGVVGHYEELTPLPAVRKGWQENWLKHQKLDIRPKQVEMAAAADISRSAARAKRQAREKASKR